MITPGINIATQKNQTWSVLTSTSHLNIRN